MKLTQTIHINADAQTIWPFIADPDLHTLWNPGIESIHRQSQGPASHGDVFEVIFKMSGKTKTRKVTVIQAQPARLIIFDHYMLWNQKEQTIVETYELTPNPSGVTITQTVDTSRSNIPKLLQLLFRVFQFFGKDLRPKTLVKLKHVIENPPELPDEIV